MIASLLALAAVLPATQAAAAQSAVRAPSEIVAAAPAGEWRAIPASDLLVMDLAPDAAGRARRVVIQLMPAPFSQGWVGNVRALATAHWWDGTSINRVQDNYVVQWGDATEKKPLPAGLVTMTENAYDVPVDAITAAEAVTIDSRNTAAVVATLQTGNAADAAGKAAMQGTITAKAPNGWHERDSYVGWVEIHRGWPLASNGKTFWPIHCYGMVGVGRNVSPDTGTGAELYTVIGHAPRHLDRNVALIGRVVEGIEQLSSLPRGTEALGFYKTPAERTPIVRIRLATELPPAEQPRFEYLDTGGASFAAYANARANRKDAFFITPAGGADICNVPVPVRRAQ